ncbi:DUF3892 domain-containing protein [Methanobrevibacter sp. TMH8]|uniref:DUF3892 domain-containing protein n=1 Tax=Methanobrevibacter sp. TMH8 TaxID=2848611 RepID=UPI001CCFE571|nr:DUF3892 domain-containing protein [Methanobrevibacter sp. TMH8]MBZ9570552.1 DUF3892 domain-containing protein [Methanobrevibacter sp. TMH8]
MGKWADYCISAVRYNNKNTHIEYVEVRKDNGETIGSSETWKRADVLNKLNTGKTFCTIIFKENKWYEGADVIKVTIRGKEYIKTVNDGTEEDNLGKLPRF